MPRPTWLILAILGLGACRSEVLDADNDGYLANEDCDDHDEYVNKKWPWAQDVDGDGFGNPDVSTSACTQPDGYVPDTPEMADCDDSDPAINPESPEICDDGVDNDCDGADATVGGDCEIDLALADTRIDGCNEGDYAGWTVAAPGDVDGDSVPEIVVGALNSDVGGDSAGALYFTQASLAETASLVDAEAVFVGAERDRVGQAVAPLGDLDGDGIADLAIGAYRNGRHGGDAGEAYILRGPIVGTLDAAQAWATITPEFSSSKAGYALAWAGDTSGDGIADLFVGAPGNTYTETECQQDDLPRSGAVYLVESPYLATMSLIGTTAIRDPLPCQGTGKALAGGDLDGDGFPDLVIGSPDIGASDDGTTEVTGAGRVSVFHGPIGGELVLDDADGILAGAAGSGTGAALWSGGDLDGDGLDDLLVGAPGAGKAALFTGDASLSGSLDAGATVFTSEDPSWTLGTALQPLDFDADDTPDLVLGAPGKSRLFVYFGPIPAGTLTLDDADHMIRGERASDLAGQSLANAGDLDGDGSEDLVVGAPRHTAGNTEGPEVGGAYVLLGSAP